MNFNQFNQDNGFNIMRNDMRNLDYAMKNDDFEEVSHKNFGIFPKKNIMKIFIKRRSNI